MAKCEQCNAELTKAEGVGPFCQACEARVTPVEPFRGESDSEDEISIEFDANATLEEADSTEAATMMFSGDEDGEGQGGDDRDGGDAEPGGTQVEAPIDSTEAPTMMFSGDEDADPDKPVSLHGAPVDGKTQGDSDALTRMDERTPVPPNDSDKLATVNLDHRIRELWKGVEMEGSSPSATLRVSVSHLEGDSQLTVPPRPIAYPETPVEARADYRMEKFLAQGGMGRVYIAQQSSLGRPVAIKTLKENLAKQERQRAKFVAEASITASLEHPNIVPIHDIGLQEDGTPFYSMKCVEGQAWDKLIKNQTRAENLDILLKVCDAIAFAHSRLILHRDLKPENVMVGAYGEVLVADWGLAIHLERDKGRYSLGGTPLYMAPEMASNDGPLISERSDIYLLGGILFEIVEGRAPHDVGAKTNTERLLAAAMNRIVPHESADELIDVALKALASNPSDRYQTVVEFQQAIRECQQHADSRERSERAAAELRTARETGDNERYSRALFAFQDAIDLWPENGAARDGLAETRVAYAEHCLAEKDYAAGLSLLDAENADHKKLRKKLLAAQEQEANRGRRLRFARRVAIGATAATLLVLGVSTLLINRAKDDAVYQKKVAEEQREEAVQARNDALEAKEQERLAKVQEQEQRIKADKARVAAEEAEESERVARQNEEEQRRAAEDARDDAREAEKEAKEQERLARAAEQEATNRAFTAEVALTGADLAADNTDAADERLRALEADPDYSALLGWEADRFRFESHRDFARTQLGGPLAAMAAAPDGSRFAVLVERGGANQLALGRYDEETQALVVGDGEPIGVDTPRCVALGPDGLIAVAGRAEGRSVIELWRSGDASGRAVIASPNDDWEFTALAFSPDGAELAVAHHAPLAVRVQVLGLRGGSLPGAGPRLDDTVSAADEYALAGVGAFAELAFSGDGLRLAAVERLDDNGRSGVTVWSRASRGDRFDGANKQRLPGDARCAAFHPTDNRLLACGAAGGGLVVQELSAAGDAVRRQAYLEHADDVERVAFSPDGAMLVTASASGRGLLWTRGGDDPLAWRLDERPPLRHRGAIRCCAWADDQRTLITASANGRIRSWPLDRFFDVRRYQTALSAPATTLAADSAGRLLVVGDENGHTRVFSATDAGGAPIADLYVGHPGDTIAAAWAVGDDVMTLGVDRDGATLVRSSDENRVRLPGISENDFFDLSPRGDRLVAANLDEVRVLDLPGGERLAADTVAAVSLAYLPSGDRVAIGDASGRLSVRPASAIDTPIATESLAPGSRLIATAATRRAGVDVVYSANDAAQGVVYRIEVTGAGALSPTMLPPLPEPVRQLACAGDRLAVLCGATGHVYQFDADGSRWSRLGVDNATSVAVDDAGVVLAATSEGRLWRSDADGGAPDWADPRTEYNTVGALASGGFFAAGRRDGRPVVDRGGAGGGPTLTSRSPVMLALPLPGGRVTTVDTDGVRRVWDPQQPAAPLESQTLALEGRAIARVAVDTDSLVACLIAVDGRDAAAHRYDAKTGELRRLALPPGEPLTSQAAAAVVDGRVVVWDAARGVRFGWGPSGNQPSVWSDPNGGGTTSNALPVAVGPDGKVALVAATRGGGRELVVTLGEGGTAARAPLELTRVTSLAFSRSGDRLLAGAASGRIIVYGTTVTEQAGGAGPASLPRIDELTTFAEHRRPVVQLGFTSRAAGETLLSGDRDGGVVWWPTAPLR